MDMGNEKYCRVLDRLRHLCSVREYCTSDIRRKAAKLLEASSIEEESETAEAVDSVLRSLEKDGYVSDLRYATAYARDKSSLAGWGKSRISYMLLAKGISAENIDKAMEGIDRDRASERLSKVLRNRFRSLCPSGKPDDGSRYEVRQKLLRFAMGRGYSYDEASGVIDSLIS